MLDILSAIIASKVSGGSGSSGGGLPSVSAPHQMLVTDADGKTVWEDRTHYEEKRQKLLFRGTAFIEEANDNHFQFKNYWEESFGGRPTFEMFKLYPGEKYTVYWNGKKFECEAYAPPLDGPVAFIGNAEFMNEPGFTGGNGEPFLISVYSDQGEGYAKCSVGVTSSDLGENMLFIYGEGEACTTIEQKFLPSWLNCIETDNEYELLITWDGDKTGRDSISQNGALYYKVSDNPLPKRLYENGDLREKTSYGDSFSVYLENPEGKYVCTNHILEIYEAGTYIGFDGLEFTAPSPGTYFCKWGNNNFVEALYLKTEKECVTGITIAGGAEGRKKYFVTVDDSGTLTATEVTK